MNNEYVQNLRYKLQKRVRRLNSTEFSTFHNALCIFWKFLDSHSILRGICDDLLARVSNANDSALRICVKHEGLLADNELEQAAMAYCVIRGCIQSGDARAEIQVGHLYESDSKYNESIRAFRDQFLEPLYEYIDEQLDDQRAVLALLRRYKHKVEWFGRDALYKRWKDDTQWGERGLAEHLYEYLHDQGIDFHIEPQSASGEADLIAMQKTDDPLIADAKIFDPDRSKGNSYIAKGFAQVYRYTVDFNEPFGYLIVYLTGKHDLRFTLKEKAQSTPFVVYNNKTIFLMTIDLFPHEEPASKRGALNPVEITEEDLIKVIEEERVAGPIGSAALTIAPVAPGAEPEAGELSTPEARS
jgi:hypothetical protein